MTMKMILDVDTGIDDALAIAYAVASPEIELLGITVTYGNTPLDNAFRNTCELLRMMGVDTPAYRGAVQPLSRPVEFSGIFHGKDGLGETLGEVTEPALSEMHAVDFIIEQVHRFGKKLTIVTTGPVTNLALAMLKDPSIIALVGRVVIMGGAVMSPGNVTKFAEANIIVDAEGGKSSIGIGAAHYLGWAGCNP
ncbi:nucleoside hydrolase [Paenibacillus agricola]|uniref:nucleoside hydrolase n=1 Tax=Paenibacillus agricola TaxID=2716264 RepID=UPI001FB5CA8F|nr:nucleoside hydrolase [Paenibacillus agricola]